MESARYIEELLHPHDFVSRVVVMRNPDIPASDENKGQHVDDLSR